MNGSKRNLYMWVREHHIYDPCEIRSGGSVKKVVYNRVYFSTIFSILNYTFIPL